MAGQEGAGRGGAAEAAPHKGPGAHSDLALPVLEPLPQSTLTPLPDLPTSLPCPPLCFQTQGKNVLKKEPMSKEVGAGGTRLQSLRRAAFCRRLPGPVLARGGEHAGIGGVLWQPSAGKGQQGCRFHAAPLQP